MTRKERSSKQPGGVLVAISDRVGFKPIALCLPEGSFCIFVAILTGRPLVIISVYNPRNESKFVWPSVLITEVFVFVVNVAKGLPILLIGDLNLAAAFYEGISSSAFNE